MAFLDGMQWFKGASEKSEPGLCLPYKIYVKKGLTEDPRSNSGFYPIRTHLNMEEDWTKAFRLVLINFKCSLTWVSLKYCQK